MRTADLDTAGLGVRLTDNVDAARMATHDLLQDPSITAVACASDTLAIGALHACAERGLEPGRDVGIVGFDDSLAAQVTCRVSAWGTENVLCDLTGVFVWHVKVSCRHTFIVSLSNALSAAHQTQLWCATWRLAQVVDFRHAPALWQAAFLLLHTTLLVVQLLLLLVLLLLLLL